MQTTMYKNGAQNYILDIPNNQLTFADSRFYITATGDYVPSVTTILDCYPKSAAFYEWLKKVGEDADKIRDEAGNRGSIVHKLTEDYDNGLECNLLNDNGFIEYKLGEWKAFERYVTFRNRADIETNIIHTELNVVSDLYKVGGTVDRVMQINGETLVVDIKTSNAMHNHYYLQLAAYQKMLEEINIKTDGIAILWLNAKTKTEGRKGALQGEGYQLLKVTDEEEISGYWSRFLACYQLWKAENGSMKPNRITYSLKHKLNQPC